MPLLSFDRAFARSGRFLVLAFVSQGSSRTGHHRIQKEGGRSDERGEEGEWFPRGQTLSAAVTGTALRRGHGRLYRGGEAGMILAGEDNARCSPGAVPFAKCGKCSDLEGLSKWRSSCRLRKIPFFILFVSALQVVVFYVADDNLKRFLPYRTESKKEIWRFLTYMLLHTNGVHLGLNVFIQGLLGTPLELEQGRLRCAVIYFGGGLAGSLGTSAFASFPSMVGASGGVYALLISQIPNLVLNHETIKYAVYRIVTVAALTASDVVYILCHVYFFNNEKPRIGWVAHASGAAAGLLLGFLTFTGTSKWRRKFQMTSCVILVLPSVLVIVFSVVPSALRFLSR